MCVATSDEYCTSHSCWDCWLSLIQFSSITVVAITVVRSRLDLWFLFSIQFDGAVVNNSHRALFLLFSSIDRVGVDLVVGGSWCDRVFGRSRMDGSNSIFNFNHGHFSIESLFDLSCSSFFDRSRWSILFFLVNVVDPLADLSSVNASG